MYTYVYLYTYLFMYLKQKFHKIILTLITYGAQIVLFHFNLVYHNNFFKILVLTLGFLTFFFWCHFYSVW